MNITPLAIPDVLLIEPRVFGDERGFFYESFNQRAFTQGTGVTLPFVQDNHSKSARGVCAACTTRCKTRKASWCV
jgi:dTDP-4-dehydrorhamnose 3,5-epimerase